MAQSTELERFYIRLSKEVAAFYRERAQLMGTSLTAVMAMGLTEYCESKKGIDAMQKMMEQMKKQEGQKTLPKPDPGVL